MSRTRMIALWATAALVAAVPPAAGAHPGDWALSGAFERTTAPSFQGNGFNPDDVDRIDVAFDNRAKSLAIAIRHFEVPTRGPAHLVLGRSRPDGVCAATAEVALTASALPTTILVTEEERYWVPEQHSYSNGYYWRTREWIYLGYDTRIRRHHWVRPGHFETRSVTREVPSIDAHAHERVAELERTGVAGRLVASERVGNDATAFAWTLAHPLLDQLPADCLELRVPGRLDPYVIAPPAQPAEGPPEEPTEASTAAAKAPRVAARVVRRPGRIELRLTRRAKRVQVRAARLTRTRQGTRRIVLRGRAARSAAVRIRVDLGTGWSAWVRVPLRPASPTRSGPVRIR